MDTPNGLVVPVIRDADQKSVYDLARDLGEMSVKARDGKLKSGHAGRLHDDFEPGWVGVPLSSLGQCSRGCDPWLDTLSHAAGWNGKEFIPR